MDTPVFDVVHMFSERGISAVPILDEDGIVVNLYETVDVIVSVIPSHYIRQHHHHHLPVEFDRQTKKTNLLLFSFRVVLPTTRHLFASVPISPSTLPWVRRSISVPLTFPES